MKDPKPGEIVSFRIPHADDEEPIGADPPELTDQDAADADQTAADADQTAADADQTTSDTDESAAARDEADAASDQQVSEADQARADRQLPADADAPTLKAYEASKMTREATTIHRIATHDARARTTTQRAATAVDRDVTAARRDETARLRDERARALERSIAMSDASLAEKMERVRARAEADRMRAAADRARAAQDRADAARERARLEAALNSAHLDDLTGAFRREAGWLALNNEIDRARRGDGRFVIAFADVDGMKSLNDRDGHAAGDNVLRTLVAAMRSHLRSFDPIVRYGGDEFVCGLGGADLDEVGRRFELIGQSLRAEVGVGISVGLAALAPDETLDQLTARADAALLEIKHERGA